MKTTLQTILDTKKTATTPVAAPAPVSSTDLSVDQVKQNLSNFYATKPVASISTEQAKNNIQNLEADHSQDMERLTVSESNKKVNQEATQKKAEEGDRKRGGLSTEEITTLGGDVNQYTYSPLSGLYMPKSTTTPQDDLQKDQDALEKVYNDQAGLIDSSTNAVLESVKTTYAELAKEQREANEASAAQIQNVGLRTGGSRYSPGSFTAIQNAGISAGIKSLGKLASDEYKLIMQAESARADKKYTLFAKKRDDIKSIRDEKQKVITKLQEGITKKLEEVKKQKIQASRDGAIADLLSQGVTDPEEILQYLNYDQAGNLIGDFTAKEIGTALKTFAPNGDIKSLTGEVKNFAILKENGLLESLLPEIAALPEGSQFQAYLDTKKKAPAPVKPKAVVLKFKFSAPDTKRLAATNLTQPQIVHIEEGINKYGIKEVLDKETGLSAEQRKALTELFLEKKKASDTTISAEKAISF